MYLRRELIPVINEYCKEKEKSWKGNYLYISKRTYRDNFPIWHKDYDRYYSDYYESLDSKEKRNYIEELLTPSVEIGQGKRGYIGYNPLKLTMRTLVTWQLKNLDYDVKRCFLSDEKIDDWLVNDDFTIDELKACGMYRNINIHSDHFISLSTGHVGTVLGNYYPLSQALNSTKGKLNPYYWYERKNLHKIDQKKWVDLISFNAKCFGMDLGEYREFVFWCYEYPRTIEEIIADGEVSSVELFRSRKKVLPKEKLYANPIVEKIPVKKCRY